MRERPDDGKTLLIDTRITPARAGKTCRLYTRWRAGEDHPRSCGKDLVRFCDAAVLQGSPPLVRERLKNEDLKAVPEGITPARAGKTLLDGGKRLGR